MAICSPVFPVTDAQDDESPVEKIAQLICIPGESACYRMQLLLISSSFLLNHEPILIFEGYGMFVGLWKTVLALEGSG